MGYKVLIIINVFGFMFFCEVDYIFLLYVGLEIVVVLMKVYIV